MNEVHWHLVMNHAPIFFPIVGVIVMITGLISKSEAVKRTAYLVFIIGAITTLPTMFSGEGAEEVVEHMSGVSHNYIHHHEEQAESFATLSYILGGLSLFGIWASFKEKSVSKLLSIITIVFASVVIYFGKVAGTSGGEIRHTEIRGNQVAPALEQDEDDDD